MNPMEFRSASLDMLLQHLVRLDFEEANNRVLKQQLLSELDVRLKSAQAQANAAAVAATSPVEQAIAAQAAAAEQPKNG